MTITYFLSTIQINLQREDKCIVPCRWELSSLSKQALGEKKPNSKPKKLHLGGLVLGIVEGTSHILHQFPIVLVVLATAQ